MKLAFFGGTFDPVHLGHLAVAKAATEKLGLDLVYFVPTDVPPHKRSRNLTDFQHRFAMLALATADERRFVPSLLEANSTQTNYSIDTIRRLKGTLASPDKLYFLIGADAFREIASWRQPVELLSECDFVVASRPGYSLEAIEEALPKSVRSEATLLKGTTKDEISRVKLGSTTIHLLDHVDQPISSTEIRSAASSSIEELSKYVPGLVAEYIRKQHLYVGEPAEEEK